MEEDWIINRANHVQEYLVDLINSIDIKIDEMRNKKNKNYFKHFILEKRLKRIYKDLNYMLDDLNDIVDYYFANVESKE